MSIVNSIDDFVWPTRFCKEFNKIYWETEPVVFEYPAKRPLATLEELFDALVNMPNYEQNDRFWVSRSRSASLLNDYRLIQGNAISLLGPNSKDNDFEGFFNRMSPKGFGLNIQELGKGLEVIDVRMSKILTQLRENNMAAHPDHRMWVSDTFLGNYQSTPFGIHRDPASVFALCLYGSRTYYTWEPDYFPPNHQDLGVSDIEIIAQHMPSARSFTVKPGHLFYWPSNRWHLVVSDSQPSIVVQMSVYFDPSDVNQN